VYFFIFETKDKSLERMDEVYGDIDSSNSSEDNLPEKGKAPVEETTVAV
jgi:hypothetical protein